MISDLRDGEAPAEIVGDVCVVGTGPAGVTIALELARKGRNVVLLEGGGAAYEADSQELYRGQVIGHHNIDVAASRLRQFGGTSGHWTGLCAPLDPIDFESRADVPHHGWPIGRADVDPFYARAQPYLDLGPYRYDWRDWAKLSPHPALPLDPAKVFTAVYQQSPPTRFAEKFRDTIANEPRIACWLHANLVDIALQDGSDAVQSLTVSTLDGRIAKVRAATYVLACGGLENARILLNARRQRPAGIGNEHDLVGRYYTDHMTIETSLALINPGVDTGLYPETIDIDGAALVIGLKINPDVVKRENLNNNTAFLVPQYEDEVYSDDFRNYGWIAFSTMLKTFSRGHVPDRLGERTCDVIDDLPAVATGVYRNAMRRVFPPEAAASAYKLRQDAEQSPNPDSRVTLIAEKDHFGLNRIALDWKVANADLLKLRRSHELIGEALGAAGIGRVQLGISDPPDPSIAFSGYHHMGTTRMHDSPREGVVDANGRVHSVKNLYMAGSSVFTSGGCANPTLTITALAIRLADRLAAIA
jgi:choline dehydrogenase-like flavoprotein